MVAHESVAERDAARLGVALRGVVPRIGHGHDDVRIDRLRAREAAPHLDAHLGDVASAEVAVGSGEINEFEDAERGARRCEGTERTHTFRVDDHDLAGRDLALELRSDEIQRAGFRGEHVRVAEAAEDERTEPVRVAHADERLGREHDETERALQRAQSGERFAGRGLTREKMKDDLAIRRGLKKRPGILQLGAQSRRVDQVAVVRDGQRTAHGVGDKRLRVGQRARTGRRVTHVADGAIAFQFSE